LSKYLISHDVHLHTSILPIIRAVKIIKHMFTDV